MLLVHRLGVGISGSACYYVNVLFSKQFSLMEKSSPWGGIKSVDISDLFSSYTKKRRKGL